MLGTKLKSLVGINKQSNNNYTKLYGSIDHELMWGILCHKICHDYHKRFPFSLSLLSLSISRFPC